MTENPSLADNLKWVKYILMFEMFDGSGLLISKWDKDKFADKSNKPKFFVQNSSAKFTIRAFDQKLKFTLH